MYHRRVKNNVVPIIGCIMEYRIEERGLEVEEEIQLLLFSFTCVIYYLGIL